MAKAVYGLLFIGIVLSLFGVFIAFDLLGAVGAEACIGDSSRANCYPWGAEGPAAELWRYQSKSIYFISGLAIGILPIIATASIVLRSIQKERLTSWHRAVVGLVLLATLVLNFA